MSITPQQVKAARRLLGWSQPALAARARINREAVLAFENGRRRVSDDSMFAIRRAFEGAGVEFSPWSASFRNEKAGP